MHFVRPLREPNCRDGTIHEADMGGCRHCRTKQVAKILSMTLSFVLFQYRLSFNMIVQGQREAILGTRRGKEETRTRGKFGLGFGMALILSAFQAFC